MQLVACDSNDCPEGRSERALVPQAGCEVHSLQLNRILPPATEDAYVCVAALENGSDRAQPTAGNRELRRPAMPVCEEPPTR